MFSKAQILKLGVVLTGFGIFLIVMGNDHMEELKHQNGPPREMRCRDLRTLNEPGLDARIMLSEFRFGEEGYVGYDKDFGGGFDQVFIPAYPSDTEGIPQADDYSTIIHLFHVESEEEMWNTLSQPKLMGKVWKRGDELGNADRNILSKLYPGLDYSKTWIVNIGDYTASAGTAWRMQAGGAGSLLAGILFLCGLAFSLIKNRQTRVKDRETQEFGSGSPEFGPTF